MESSRFGVVVAAALALAACGGVPVSDEAETAAPASPETSASGPLDGQFWRLARVDRGPLAGLAGAREVTLGFDEGRAFGFSGCNRHFAPYALSGERLQLQAPGSTMMYCEGEGSAVEQAFLPLLENPFVLEREGEGMRLIAPDGTRLEFEAAPMESGSR